MTQKKLDKAATFNLTMFCNWHITEHYGSRSVNILYICIENECNYLLVTVYPLSVQLQSTDLRCYSV